MESSAALRNLFHPIDPAEIADAAAHDRRLYRRTERAEAFAHLLPWATLNSLITSQALAERRVTIARQGRPLPLEMVGAADSPRSGDWVAPEAIQNLCEQGASLILNDVERLVPAIAGMNAMVERYLRCDTITNAYASFNRESAFKAHFDAQNVLILQLCGSKRWWCYGQRTRFPLQGRTFPSLDDLPPPEWEGVLEPGDILFVPRGDVHRAAVEGTSSLHLTVTMTPPTGADVLAWLGRASLREELGRQYLPILADADRRREHQEALRAVFHRLVDTLDIDAFLADADHARPPARPLSLGLGQSLRPAMVVQPALRRRIPLERETGGGDHLDVGGRIVALSASEREVLALLLEEDVLSMRQIVDRLPDLDAYAAVAGLARKSLVFLFA